MRIIIAGGGTYGHIAPGLAIFNEFEKRNHEVIFICSPRDANYKKIIELNGKVKIIPITPFKRYDFPAKIKFVFNFARGYLASRRIIKKFKPDVIVGVGGYVAGAPLMVVRKKKKIKKILLEQNTLPGAVNRYFSKYADLSILTFEMSKKWIRGKYIVMGNPVLLEKKDEFYNKGLNYFNLNKKDFVLTVMGGSAGAKIINDTTLEILKDLKDIRIIWSTGEIHYNEIKDKVKDYKNVNVYPFIDKMEYLLSITNLMVSRAGATSIAEICFMGVPAILIPYKWSSENHQVHNADFVVQGNGAEMIEEDDLNPEILKQRILHFYKNKDELNKMKKNIEGLFSVDVKKQIADKIEEVVCP